MSREVLFIFTSSSIAFNSAGLLVLLKLRLVHFVGNPIMGIIFNKSIRYVQLSSRNCGHGSEMFC